MEQCSLRYYYYYSRLIEITYSTIVAPPSNPARSDRLHPCIRCLSFGNRVGQRFQANEAGLRRREARSRFSIKIRYSLVTVTRFAASRLRNARVCVCVRSKQQVAKRKRRGTVECLSSRIELNSKYHLLIGIRGGMETKTIPNGSSISRSWNGFLSINRGLNLIVVWDICFFEISDEFVRLFQFVEWKVEEKKLFLGE